MHTIAAARPFKIEEDCRNDLDLPSTDNTSAGLAALLAANQEYRKRPWPAPFDRTEHRLHLGDAREVGWIPDNSVELVVTSPPYWTLKKYEDRNGQLGEITDYETFLDELDKVWRHCARVLVEGGRICCVVGDVCIPRKRDGRIGSCRFTETSRCARTGLALTV